MERSRKKTVGMTEAETFNLISKIQEQRCLWDRTHKDNRRQLCRDEAWETISRNIGYNADDLVEKWRSLQSTYRNCKMRCRTAGSSSVAWVYFPAMKFLDGINDGEERNTLTPPMEHVNFEVPNSHKQVRTVKLRLRRKLLPNGIKRRQLMRRTLPTSLNRPELHLKDEVKEESVSNSPSSPDIDATHKDVKQLEEPFGSSHELEGIHGNVPTQTHQAPVITEEDEDFFYVQSVAYLLKQFPSRVKRKLQIEIHDLIVKAQKREYEKQFGDPFD